jgi:hypothetical protein
MSGLELFLAIFVGFTVVGILAAAFGVDSRPDSDDPRAPACGLG